MPTSYDDWKLATPAHYEWPGHEDEDEDEDEDECSHCLHTRQMHDAGGCFAGECDCPEFDFDPGDFEPRGA